MVNNRLIIISAIRNSLTFRFDLFNKDYILYIYIYIYIYMYFKNLIIYDII